MKDQYPSPPLPPKFPPIEQFRISKKHATQKTIEARSELFEKEKGKTYLAIFTTADKGSYHTTYKYPENCNVKDIQDLQNELIGQGFEAKFESGIYGDTLEISWYPEN